MATDPFAYLGATASALATKMTGQTAMNTIIPKATNSGRRSGCARYAYRSLKKREARKNIELLGSMFMSTIDKALTFAFHRKGNVPVTLAVSSLESRDTAPAIPRSYEKHRAAESRVLPNRTITGGSGNPLHGDGLEHSSLTAT
jgi:hypothetical protein